MERLALLAESGSSALVYSQRTKQDHRCWQCVLHSYCNMQARRNALDNSENEQPARISPPATSCSADECETAHTHILKASLSVDNITKNMKEAGHK